MAKADPQSPSARGTTRRALVVVGVLALAGLAYAIARVDILRARIVTQEINMDTVQRDNLALRSRVEALVLSNQNSTAQLSQLRSELGALTDNFGELHTRAEQAQRISERSEALYLLRLASNQLRLAHDIAGAIDTLTAAEIVLRASGDAALEAIHQQVQSQLAQLRTLPRSDIAGIQQQLSAASQQIVSLRLAGIPAAIDASTDNLPAPGLARAWAVLKRGMTSLFVIKKTDAETNSLLSTDEQGMRRRHLQLLLLSATQAVHLHDQQAYSGALNDGIYWLNQSFDTADPGVSQLRTQLGTLAQQNIAPSLPDLAPTIQTLTRLAGTKQSSP